MVLRHAVRQERVAMRNALEEFLVFTANQLMVKELMASTLELSFSL